PSPRCEAPRCRRASGPDACPRSACPGSRSGSLRRSAGTPSIAAHWRRTTGRPGEGGGAGGFGSWRLRWLIQQRNDGACRRLRVLPVPARGDRERDQGATHSFLMSGVPSAMSLCYPFCGAGCALASMSVRTSRGQVMADRDDLGGAWKVPPSRYLAGRAAEFAVGAPRSVYVTMPDGCRLAVDVFLPGGDDTKR